ncbi:MAG: hypothetical protein DI627_15220 [Acinetobacter sp.]|uniref:hypothetical protein n=1 Tax=Acinetobacter sp. TaxID=472 RepID=UPI000DB17CAC|nr:hypothetical protein [Acinetobacter sp.]PZT84583.1 MAG: hypothetical protein DI627_15220 [Acinetobacter sp.]
MTIKPLNPELSHIEIRLDGEICFSHTVPIDGSPHGLATNDVPTNLKIKEILEHALGFVDISLKSQPMK